VIAYPAMLDVPRELVTFLAGLLAEERAVRGTRTNTRALSCGKQALFALVWFRERRESLSDFSCKPRLTESLLGYHTGSRPGKRTTSVFRACFQPHVPVPDSPPRLLEMLRRPR